MSTLNNVNVTALEGTAAQLRENPAAGRRTNRIQGTWNLEPDQPQFSATLGFEGGSLPVEADQPTFQGGGGRQPGPMHYCLFGLASCFTATFATVAAMEGVELQELRVTAESDVNFTKTMGLSEDPIIEGVRISLTVKSGASEDEIKEVARLAEERCPAVYCLTHPVSLTSSVTRLD